MSRPALAAVLGLLLAPPALAAEPATAPPPAALDAAPGDPRLASIFQYDAPQGPHRLRAALEITTGIALQFTNYLSNPSATAVSGGRRYSPFDKLFRGAVTFDGNTELTNFVGHPLSGAFYYGVARGNRLSTWASALVAVGSSAVWELTEFHETASVNDLIVTPMAGVAIGEPAAQLSAFFEQRAAGPGDRVLAWVLQPFKLGHDAWDGARAVRRPEALAWHDFRLSAGAGAVWRGGAAVPFARAGLETVLVRGAGRDEPGRGARALLDGNVTRLALGAGGSRDGLESARLESEALLAALAWRDLGGEPGAVEGQDLLLGAGVGFEYGLRRAAAAGRLDWASLVHVPAARLEWRWLGPGRRIEATLAGGLTFGGVRSFVLAGDGAAVPPADLPLVGRAYGYDFAWGAALRPGLLLRVGPFAAGAEGRLDWLSGITARDPAPLPGGRLVRLSDRRSEVRGVARWSPAGPGGVEVGVEAGRAWREGRAGGLTRSAAATEALLTLAVPR